jgi:hypothetical protein
MSCHHHDFIDNDGSDAEDVKNGPIDKIVHNDLPLVGYQNSLLIVRSFHFDQHTDHEYNNGRNVNHFKKQLVVLAVVL